MRFALADSAFVVPGTADDAIDDGGDIVPLRFRPTTKVEERGVSEAGGRKGYALFPVRGDMVFS